MYLKPRLDKILTYLLIVKHIFYDKMSPYFPFQNLSSQDNKIAELCDLVARTVAAFTISLKAIKNRTLVYQEKTRDTPFFFTP